MKELILSIVFAAVGLGAGYLLFKSDEAGGQRVETRGETSELVELRAELERKDEQLANKEKLLKKTLEEHRALAARVQELKRAAGDAAGKEPEPAPTGPPTEDEVKKTIRAFAGKLQAIWVGGGGEEELAAMKDVLKRGGKPLRDKLIGRYRDDATDVQELVILAHVLGQSAHPEAIEALQSVIRDPDAGDFHQRFAAHGLAFSPAEGLETFLAETAHEAKDLGTRANAAFGLARRGVDEGYKLYAAATDEAFESRDPFAVAYLGGFTLMGKKGQSFVRERLLTYKDPQAVLSLIEMARSAKDKAAVPNLEKLAYDANQPVSIQKAAKAALASLTGKPPTDDDHD